MLTNILYWAAVEKYGNIIIDDNYIDYLNPLIHGSVLSIFSVKEIFYEKKLNTEFSNEQLEILDFSRGYFIYDLFKMIINKKYRNNAYIMHHICLLYFFNFFKKYNLGDVFNEALFLGELTNPILQIWLISYQSDNKVLFRYTNHLFVIMYSIFRLILIPISTYNRSKMLLNNSNINKYDLKIVLSLFMLFNIGNMVWGRNLIKGYLKWLKKNN